MVKFVFSPPPSADGFYPDGTQVSVTATPYNGFTFKQWSGDLSGTSLTASVVMNAPRFAVALLDGFPLHLRERSPEFRGRYSRRYRSDRDPTSPSIGDDLAATTKSSPAGELVASPR